MANVTRRNFLQAAAVAGGMVGLAGCNAGTGTTGSCTADAGSGAALAPNRRISTVIP